MPIYEYACRECDARFEKLVRSMSPSGEQEKVACPECGSKRTERALSVFAVASESPRRSAGSPAPGMCGRCGREGPCTLPD